MTVKNNREIFLLMKTFAIIDEEYVNYITDCSNK